MIDIKPYISIIIAPLFFTLIPYILNNVKVHIFYQLTIMLFILCIIPIISILIINHKKKNKKNYNIYKEYFKGKESVLISLIFFLYFFFFYNSFKIIPVSISIPIFMCYPLVFVIFNRIINKVMFNDLQLVSFFITLIGVVIVIFKNKNNNSRIMKYIPLLFLSIIFYSLGYTYLKNFINKKKEYIKDISNFEYINIELLICGYISFLFLFVISIIYYALIKTNYIKKNNESNINFKIILFLLFIYIILSYIQNILSMYGFNKVPFSDYSIITNVQIIWGLIVGYFIMNEKITIKEIIGCIVIIIGIILEIFSRGKKKLGKLKLKYY